MYNPAAIGDDPARTAAPLGRPEYIEDAQEAARAIVRRGQYDRLVAEIREVLAEERDNTRVLFAAKLGKFDRFDLGEVFGDITHTDFATLLAATFDDRFREPARAIVDKLIADMAERTAAHLAEQEVQL